MTNAYPRRDLASREARDMPRDILQSVFATELLAPSRPLWILSPWISDVELIDNRGGRFCGIEPSWPNAGIRLMSILRSITARGGQVTIVVNRATHNDEFERRLQVLADPALRFIRDELVHAKGIVGERFLVAGSMNLTYSGVYRNDEHVEYDTDPARIHEWRVELEQRWGASG